MITSPFLLWICRIAGTGLAATSLYLTYTYGANISSGIAWALTIASFMASYIWPIMVEVLRNAPGGILGHAIKAMAVALAVGLSFLDITTNSSTTGSHKAVDVQKASLQTTRYDDARRTVADLEAKKTFFRQRIKQLEGSDGWKGEHPSASYDGKIAAKREAVRQETNRGGCGPVCLKLTNELAQLEASRAVSEAHEKAQRMLAASVAGLQKARAEAKATNKGFSNTEHQNVKLASIFTLDRKPGEGAVWWTDTGMMLWIGVIITLASQFFNLLAWVPKVSDGSVGNASGVSPFQASANGIHTPQDSSFLRAVRDATSKLAPEQPRIAA